MALSAADLGVYTDDVMREVCTIAGVAAGIIALRRRVVNRPSIRRSRRPGNPGLPRLVYARRPADATSGGEQPIPSRCGVRRARPNDSASVPCQTDLTGGFQISNWANHHGADHSFADSATGTQLSTASGLADPHLNSTTNNLVNLNNKARDPASMRPAPSPLPGPRTLERRAPTSAGSDPPFPSLQVRLRPVCSNPLAARPRVVRPCMSACGAACRQTSAECTALPHQARQSTPPRAAICDSPRRKSTRGGRWSFPEPPACLGGGVLPWGHSGHRGERCCATW
jgi:hypothetical protein